MSSLFPHFPVFLDLAGRAVILLGDEPALQDLAQHCLAAGASVTAFAPTPSDAMRAMAPGLRLKLRRWRPSDFKGATLVVVSRAEPRPIRARTAAHAAEAMFHACGAPELSDVALGDVAARGGLSIGVSAPGAPSALATAVRDRLEAALPAGLADFLAAASRARAEVERALPDAGARERFWRTLAARAFDEKRAGPGAWDAFIREYLEAN